MKGFYHGILLNLQFNESDFIENNFNIFAKRKSATNPWILYGIEVGASDVDSSIARIQEAMKGDEPYYAHLYNDEEVIVIFKEKVFRVTPHISSWTEIIEFGRNLGIPQEQLDFWPNRFQDERHYFKKEHYTKKEQT